MVNATSLPPYLRERATLPIVEEVVWDPGPVCRSMVTSSPWSVAIPITPSPFNVPLQGFTGLRATISIECSCRNLTFPPHMYVFFIRITGVIQRLFGSSAVVLASCNVSL